MKKEYKKVILKNGKTVYKFDVSLGKENGKYRRTTVTSETLKEGREKVAKLKLGVVSTARKDSMTFKEAYSLFLKTNFKNKAENTKLSYQQAFRHFECLYNIKIDKISRLDIEALKDSINTKSVNLYLTQLNSFLNWCINMEIIKSKPFIKKEKKFKEKKLNFLTEDEFAKLLPFIDYNFRLAFTVLFYTGIRKGELCGLSSSDLINHELHLSHVFKNGKLSEIFKTDKSKRIIPIPQWLEDELKQEFKKNNYPFVKKYNTLYQFLKKAIKISGIKKNISVHDFRHSYVSMLINKGVDFFTISNLVGHSSTSITLNIYGHLYDKKRDEVRSLFENRVNLSLFENKTLN